MRARAFPHGLLLAGPTLAGAGPMVLITEVVSDPHDDHNRDGRVSRAPNRHPETI